MRKPVAVPRYVLRGHLVLAGALIGLALAGAVALGVFALYRSGESIKRLDRTDAQLRQIFNPTPEEYRAQLAAGIERCLREPECRRLFPKVRTASSKTSPRRTPTRQNGSTTPASPPTRPPASTAPRKPPQRPPARKPKPERSNPPGKKPSAPSPKPPASLPQPPAAPQPSPPLPQAAPAVQPPSRSTPPQVPPLIPPVGPVAPPPPPEARSELCVLGLLCLGLPARDRP